MAGTVYGEKYSLIALADMNGDGGGTGLSLSTYADGSATNIILPDDFVTTFGTTGLTSVENQDYNTYVVTVASSGRFADNWYNDAVNFVWSTTNLFRMDYVNINAGANARTKSLYAVLDSPFEPGSYTLVCTFYHSVPTFLNITDTKTWNIDVVGF